MPDKITTSPVENGPLPTASDINVYDDLELLKINGYPNSDRWKETHLEILGIYFGIALFFSAIFIISRLLIGKADFFVINYEYIIQFMVPLYYVYITAILVISLKGRNSVNYISKRRDKRQLVRDKKQSKLKELSLDDQKKIAYKSRRLVVKTAITREISDLKFILLAFIPVSLLFYIVVHFWSLSDSSIFNNNSTTSNKIFAEKLWENFVFVAEVFTKGIFADFMEHYNINFTETSINHSSSMFSVFVLTFRTSISVLFISTIYRALNLRLRLKTVSGKKMYIASIVSQLSPAERLLGKNK